jgi:hypothetical protein
MFTQPSKDLAVLQMMAIFVVIEQCSIFPLKVVCFQVLEWREAAVVLVVNFCS